MKERFPAGKLVVAAITFAALVTVAAAQSYKLESSANPASARAGRQPSRRVLRQRLARDRRERADVRNLAAQIRCGRGIS